MKILQLKIEIYSLIDIFRKTLSDTKLIKTELLIVILKYS